MGHVLAIIPARAGSKGLPGKNIINLRGRPLIAWTIKAAQDCPEVDQIIVSTDGEKIAQIAEAEGADVKMRPANLATDQAMPKDAIRYHLKTLKDNNEDMPSIIVLLQPTSPLRRAADITACLSAVMSGNYDSAATFVKAPSSPYRAWTMTENGPQPFVEGYDPWVPRQSIPVSYVLNGAVYAVRTETFLADASHSFLPGRAKMVVMDEDRSLDIDTAHDLNLVDAIWDRVGSSQS